jgi:hypothetical protein
MTSHLDLTGVWSSEDGAIYFIRQIDQTIWWVEMSSPAEFHPGIAYTNVFYGVFDQAAMLLRGDWADVPRGGILQSGTALEFDVVQITVAGGGPAALELRRRAGTGGPFGATLVKQDRPAYSGDIGIFYRMDHARRNDGGSMHDHLKPYKNHVVVFGTIQNGEGVGFPPDQPRDYCSFIAAPWWHNGDPPDGDINFDIQVDRANLDTQPAFWTDGWFNSADLIRAKLDHSSPQDEGFPPFTNHIHMEIIMYGHDATAENCSAGGAVLFPGWQEATGGNSVLVNGRPVGANIVFSNPAAIGGRQLVPGPRVRVTGAMILDCHKDIPDITGDCHDGDADVHNVEIHPVYSVDFVQDFGLPRPGANLTGVWAADDVGTYYVRQIGDAVWWLGLSRDWSLGTSGDPGRPFANIFRGTRGADGTIQGQWADVPITPSATAGSGLLVLSGSGGDQAIRLTATSKTGGFGGSSWDKLYDQRDGTFPAAALIFDKVFVEFEPKTVGDSSSNQLTITNIGQLDATVSIPIPIPPPPPGRPVYTWTPSGDHVIKAGQPLVVNFVYAPQHAGPPPDEGLLSITCNAPVSPILIRLHGQGLHGSTP